MVFYATDKCTLLIFYFVPKSLLEYIQLLSRAFYTQHNLVSSRPSRSVFRKKIMLLIRSSTRGWKMDLILIIFLKMIILCISKQYWQMIVIGHGNLFTVCYGVIQSKAKFPRGQLIFLSQHMLCRSEFVKKYIFHQSLEGVMAEKPFCT